MATTIHRALADATITSGLAMAAELKLVLSAPHIEQAAHVLHGAHTATHS